MAAVGFDTLKYAKGLVEVGLPQAHAERQAQMMAEVLELNLDNLVSKDFLDARLTGLEKNMELQFSAMDSKWENRFSVLTSDLRVVKFGMGIGFTVLIIPQLQVWLS